MGTISPTPSRRALLGAFAVTSAAVVAAPVTAETLRREFDAWEDEPTILKRSKDGRDFSRVRYHRAEELFTLLEAGFLTARRDILYQTGVVIHLGLSAHLLDVGFTDDWCRDHIHVRLAKCLGYANATGFDYHDPDTNLLVAVLTPYWKWRYPEERWERQYEGPFTAAEMRKLTRALLDHVRGVTGHSHPRRWKVRHG